MNQFIKTFLACLLAFVVANILIGVFFVMVLAGIGSLFSEKAVSVEPGSVLRIDLSERIVDSPSSNPFSALGMEELLSMEVSRSLALIDVLGAIERAETDDRIEGIYLNVAPTMSLGMASLIIAHITFCLPYVILSVLPKLRQMNPNLFEAAQDLGCPPVRAFFKVVLPEIMPGIVTGMIMAFTLSIDDFVISYFTSGTTQTLPIYIYSMTRKRISPEINALSTVLFVCIMLLLIIINVRQGREERRAKKAERERA